MFWINAISIYLKKYTERERERTSERTTETIVLPPLHSQNFHMIFQTYFSCNHFVPNFCVDTVSIINYSGSLWQVPNLEKEEQKKKKKNTKFSHLVINYPVKLFTAIMHVVP
jgi:hypothetical protein